MASEVLITPEELSNLISSEPVLLIDTRDPKSYAAGHIPDAVNIHEIFSYLAT
jgi:thiosulfate/3-mercaptopyruvate sulfurtransferase